MTCLICGETAAVFEVNTRKELVRAVGIVELRVRRLS